MRLASRKKKQKLSLPVAVAKGARTDSITMVRINVYRIKMTVNFKNSTLTHIVAIHECR